MTIPVLSCLRKKKHDKSYYRASDGGLRRYFLRQILQVHPAVHPFFQLCSKLLLFPKQLIQLYKVFGIPFHIRFNLLQPFFYLRNIRLNGFLSPNR